ncbi:MAG TPA: response regulator [Coleofasciculaceae cyanobacterium]|jgi:CheY-like chemotaxis protein
MSSALSEFPAVSPMSLERPKKPKMLVVDDEPDNLDLLYRTFRRDFNVLRAESGFAALEVLATEGEVAVIISDQRMPEMKGTEFLSKTVPQFPDTMRIILTGFTDVEDLVEAINSGQVYKYITKPWDPTELKGVVQRAAETYELLKQRTEELHRAQALTTLLGTIVTAASESTQKDDCLQLIADACGKVFGADRCRVQRVEGESLGAQGSYGFNDALQPLDQPSDVDPLVQAAIATRKFQAAMPVATDPALSNLPYYADSNIQACLVAPVIFRDQVLATLSLQWRELRSLQADEFALIELSAQQIGMALACAQ